MIFSNRGYFMMFRMVHLTMTIDIQKFYKTYQHYIINITIYSLLQYSRPAISFATDRIARQFNPSCNIVDLR